MAKSRDFERFRWQMRNVRRWQQEALPGMEERKEKPGDDTELIASMFEVGMTAQEIVEALRSRT